MITNMRFLLLKCPKNAGARGSFARSSDAHGFWGWALGQFECPAPARTLISVGAACSDSRSLEGPPS